MNNALELKPFGEIGMSKPFFDSLRSDYPGFDTWFEKKALQGEVAYVLEDEDGSIGGFLYLKIELGTVDDVVPPFPVAKRLKIGTFKIDGHGTKLGERFLKKALDQSVIFQVDEIYVTVFAKHEGLTRLFSKYGFSQVAIKLSVSGESELVFSRSMGLPSGDTLKDYPYVHTKGHNKYLLAIYPEWHTRLLPDSILNSESFDTVKDLSHTNSIHKVYISAMPLDVLKPGDILVMYRTKDRSEVGAAEYRSVATSVCVVEAVKRANEFETEAEFLTYCGPYSVFSETELKGFYKDKFKTRVVKFTYNVAMSKRLIRKILIEDVGISRDLRFAFIKLTEIQFDEIINLGGVNANFIID